MSKERYIAAKEAWAAKQGAKDVQPRAEAASDRLPPGQKLTSNFPVLDLGIQPDVPLSEWTLTLDGAVESPFTLDWTAFNALLQVDDVSDCHCVTTWSKYDCRWTGAAFTELYARVKPTAAARFVYFTGYDGYSTNVPLENCLDDDVLIATHFDHPPLSREHGEPAPVVLPKLYAWKGTKFVKGIHFLPADKLGFWEIRGYFDRADPWKEERYA
ncbi:MAG: molybdopterin-dependent oxidoreductase [Candidatus Synoicihabitans palmerolidicus]|nr:molybdopterin-dependent oxidoreductase [Candidatus Synoicihabitans palmerolidicus]